MEKTPRHRDEVDPDDAELMDRVRVGDVEAFGLLYRRHARAALGFARQWSHDAATAEDLRAEAFSRTLCALLSGAGPRGPLGPYLYTVIRNVSADWHRRDRMTHLVGDLAELPAPASGGDAHLDAFEYSLAVKAFNALPERWRTVLRHTLVDEQECKRVAAQLGIGVPAAASLAYRAREGLRQAYLQVHIGRVASESCRPFAMLLGAYTRGGLGNRQESQVRSHLRDCPTCSALARMLRGINATLRTGAARQAHRGRAPARPGIAHSTPRSKSFKPPLESSLSVKATATARAVPGRGTAGWLVQLAFRIPAEPLYRAQHGRRRRRVAVRDQQGVDSPVPEVRILAKVAREQRLHHVDGRRRPWTFDARRPGSVPVLQTAVRPARDA
jgi:RNA polymerase sigma factor (sigma-70 family)